MRGGGGDRQIHKTGGALYGVLKRPGFCWLEGRKAFDVTASQILALSHIGAGVVFLASSRERFNTGISLTVDGGLDAGQWLLSPEPEITPALSDSIAFPCGRYFAICHQAVILSGCPTTLCFRFLSSIKSIQHVDSTSFLRLYGLSLFLSSSPGG